MLHLIPCVRGKATYRPIDRYAGPDGDERLFEDIAVAYQHAIKAFYDEGCRYLQFDDTSWGEFCDADKRAAYEAQGINLDAVAKRYVKTINRALEAKPADMTITTHICRGNFRSTWFSSGGYEPIAETLFSHANYDGFFLEYDSDRAGDFEPLRHIRDQIVVLGLVTSKFPELEDEDTVIARIHEAAEVRAARPPAPLHAVRLLLDRRGQRPHRGRPVGQDCPGASHRGARLGRLGRVAYRLWARLPSALSRGARK